MSRNTPSPARSAMSASCSATSRRSWNARARSRSLRRCAPGSALAWCMISSPAAFPISGACCPSVAAARAYWIVTHEDTRGLGRIRAAHDHIVAWSAGPRDIRVSARSREASPASASPHKTRRGRTGAGSRPANGRAGCADRPAASRIRRVRRSPRPRSEPAHLGMPAQQRGDLRLAFLRLQRAGAIDDRSAALGQRDGAGRAVRPAVLASAAMSAGRLVQATSGWRRIVPVEVQGASISAASNGGAS